MVASTAQACNALQGVVLTFLSTSTHQNTRRTPMVWLYQ